MKRPGVWFFCVAWAALAFTWLWAAVATPNGFHAVILVVTGVMALFFTVLFVGIAAYVPRMRPESLTTRHPEYWHLPEHRAELNARIADVFYGLAGATVLLPTLLNLGALLGSLPGWAFLLVFMAAVFAVLINGVRQLSSIARGGQAVADGDAASGG